jgi:hypothetical protein
MLEYIKSELLEDEEYSMGELGSNLEEKNMSMDKDFIDTEEDPENGQFLLEMKKNRVLNK